MGIHRNVKLVNKKLLKDDIFKFSIESEEMCKLAKPGQFLEIKVCKGIDPILRRPISIYNVDEGKSIIEFIFQVKGIGTKILSEIETGLHPRLITSGSVSTVSKLETNSMLCSSMYLRDMVISRLKLSFLPSAVLTVPVVENEVLSFSS